MPPCHEARELPYPIGSIEKGADFCAAIDGVGCGVGEVGVVVGADASVEEAFFGLKGAPSEEAEVRDGTVPVGWPSCPEFETLCTTQNTES